MCLERSRARSRGASPLRRQSGFLVPLALVIVVGLGALAVAMSRLGAQSGGSAFREALSVQAFFAAESGVQYAMGRLFYPNASRAGADAACAAIEGSSLSLDTEGLRACTAELSCSQSSDATNSISFYTVSASATCGAGELQSERVIQASAYINEHE